ncbi:hypothetical protein BDV95DRAFT_611718 [Massariosphaeria phaeospora]|uniref:Rhodopsin domain-containing protein n=1 Tax=Massariosphaeria phaeospora TaxID=100035 RepID=A0A7C8I3S3_9PLEO|nr:hypothetical protein BDV95DRAFT_611718 [Massariosphaeria phaeospora]
MAVEPTPEMLAYMDAHAADDRSPLIYGLYSLAIVLAVVTTTLRFVLKYSVGKGIWWDDFLALLTCVLVIVQAALVMYIIPHGWGRHYWTIAASNLQIIDKTWYANTIIINAGIQSGKMAVLAFYYQSFSSRTFRRFVIAVGVSTLCWVTVVTLFLSLACWPIKKQWDASVQGHCKDRIRWWVATNVLNIISDFIIFLMPIPVLWSLHLPLKKKLGLCVVFSFGLIVCVGSIRRAIAALTMRDPDVTWRNGTIMLLYVFEPVGVLICINLPLIVRLLKTLKGPSKTVVSYEARAAQRESRNKKPNGWLRGIDSIRLTGLSTRMSTHGAERLPDSSHSIAPTSPSASIVGLTEPHKSRIDTAM